MAGDSDVASSVTLVDSRTPPARGTTGPTGQGQSAQQEVPFQTETPMPGPTAVPAPPSTPAACPANSTSTATNGNRSRSNSKLGHTMNRLKTMFLGDDGAARPAPSPVLAESDAELSRKPSKHAKDSAANEFHGHSRFEMYEDGTHAHYLKAARQKETLKSLVNDLFKAKNKRDGAVTAAPRAPVPREDEAPPPPPPVPSPAPTPAPAAGEQPPSLMSGLLNRINKEGASGGLAPPTSGASLLEKYGKCQEVVGKGSFGIVRVAHKADPRIAGREHLYAVKEFKKRPQESDAAYSKRLTSEYCISSSLHHPNIIETIDLLQDQKGEYCEVMEYCSGGDLYSLILVAGKLEYPEADCFFKQIVRGVNYMHEMGVAHRDLKPENILLSARGAVKITDFGNGECFRMAWEKEVHYSHGVCGSAPYIAPEEFSDDEFDPRAVDIWAVGVIYMAMRTGRHLWRIARAQDDEFYAQYLQGRKNTQGYEPIETLKRARCRNVIYSILDPVPSRRITGKQILKSEWGREIRVCKEGEQGI